VPFGPAYKKRDGALLADGEIIEVRVEGWKPIHYALAGDAKLLNELSAGRVPKSWKPLETTTTEEVIFLGPFDQTVARGRANRPEEDLKLETETADGVTSSGRGTDGTHSPARRPRGAARVARSPLPSRRWGHIPRGLAPLVIARRPGRGARESSSVSPRGGRGPPSRPRPSRPAR